MKLNLYQWIGVVLLAGVLVWFIYENVKGKPQPADPKQQPAPAVQPQPQPQLPTQPASRPATLPG